MGDIVLFVDDSYYSQSHLCRICHEEEFESSKSLEAPCACSGTIKYAHKDCIQRWCNEKGNIVCELCLQKFEPGYTTPPKKKALLHTTVTISESIGVGRRETELEGPEGEVVERQIHETECSECSFAAVNRSVSCCRRVAFVFTILLLARHLLAVVTGRIEEYPFTLLTIVIIKTSGIILPMYILIRMITAVHDRIRHHHHQECNDDDDDDDDMSSPDIE